MHKLSYQPGTSLIHRLYPLTKFTWMFLGTILVFIIQDGSLLIIIAILCAISLYGINHQIWHIRGFRFSVLTGMALFFLYLVFEKSGQILFNPGIQSLAITTGGVRLGLRYSGRFLTVVFLSYIFILTTDPSDLAYSLLKIGLPYRYGFMLVTALRLAPVMEDEGRTIYHAQLARGIRYDQFKLSKILILVQQLMTPLLISALRRADKLVFSMEGRGFGALPKRTFRNRTSMTYLDILISIGLLLLFTGLILINW